MKPMECGGKWEVEMRMTASRVVHPSPLLTITSIQAAFSSVIWSLRTNCIQLGTFLANSTTLMMPSELSSCTDAQPWRTTGDPLVLLACGLLIRSYVVVSGLGLLSDDSLVNPEQALTAGDDGLGDGIGF